MLNEPDAALSPEKRYDVSETIPDNDNKPVDPPMEPTYKILIADDHPLFREAISSVISTGFSGSQIIETADLDSALDITRENDDLDLILLDLNMPRMDGREALLAIKSHAQLRRIPVIVLTTSSDSGDVAQSYDNGVNSFITKPASYNELIEFVRQLGDYWLALVNLPPSPVIREE